jgi:hypothetical protein
MDFVDWVEKVMQATAITWKGLDTSSREFNGVSAEVIARALNIYTAGPDMMTFLRSKPGEALRDATTELKRIGLLVDGVEHFHYKLTQEGRKFPDVSLSTAWGQIFRVHLDEEQREFLSMLAQIGQEVYDGYVCVREVSGEELADSLGWNTGERNNSRVFYVSQALEKVGMVTTHNTIGSTRVIPTYAGIVAATRVEQSEWIPVVQTAVNDWETTNVDFKRQLNLKNDNDKAEFIHDILALATTKSSGRRFLIIGFDNKTRRFAQSVDPKIDQDQLENILNHYTEPTPSIRYHTVPWAGGTVGVIEVFRDAAKIPYGVKQPLGGQKGIKAGDIYVRHSSHTEPPTPAELVNLVAEGEDARRSQ